MRLGLYVAMTLMFSSVANGQSAPDIPPDLEARLSAQQTALKMVRDETAMLLLQQKSLNGSSALRQEEARSLQRRFPRVSIPQEVTASALIAASRGEEQKLLGDITSTLSLMQVALRKGACVKLKNLTQAQADLEKSADWPLLSLKERTAVRTLVEDSRREALENGDPCIAKAPGVQPVGHDTMLDD